MQSQCLAGVVLMVPLCRRDRYLALLAGLG